jgi:hypothetical protein
VRADRGVADESDPVAGLSIDWPDSAPPSRRKAKSGSGRNLFTAKFTTPPAVIVPYTISIHHPRIRITITDGFHRK